MLFSPDSDNRLFQIWRALINTPRAEKLDNIDAAISTRLSSTDAQTFYDTLKSSIIAELRRQSVFIFNAGESGDFVVPDWARVLRISGCAAGGQALGLGNMTGSGGVYSFANGGSAASVISKWIAVEPGQILHYSVPIGLAAYLTNVIGSYTAQAGGNLVFGDLVVPGGFGATGTYNSSTATPGMAHGRGAIFTGLSKSPTGVTNTFYFGAAQNRLTPDDVYDKDYLFWRNGQTPLVVSIATVTPFSAVYNGAGMGGIITRAQPACTKDSGGGILIVEVLA